LNGLEESLLFIHRAVGGARGSACGDRLHEFRWLQVKVRYQIQMAQEPIPARTVIAYIRDKSFEINIADGSQSVDWLTDVVLFKYKRRQFEKLNCRGVKYHNKMLDMNLSIASQVQDKEDVYILLEGDEEVDQMFGDEI
jgi:hypothetical protein